MRIYRFMAIRLVVCWAIGCVLLMSGCARRQPPPDQYIIGSVRSVGSDGVFVLPVEIGDASYAIDDCVREGVISLSLTMYGKRRSDRNPLKFEIGSRYKFYVKRANVDGCVWYILEAESQVGAEHRSTDPDPRKI